MRQRVRTGMRGYPESMRTPKTPHWRRTVEQRHSSVQPLITWGALTGVVVGVAAQFAVGSQVDSEVEWLARAALLLPAMCFMLWWMLSPTRIGELPNSSAPTIDADERIERIEAAFDAAAVPRAGRRPVDETSMSERERFRSSISRDAEGEVTDVANFGIRRPERPVRKRSL